MTISALEALWLDACLWQQPSASGLSRRFHRRTARIVGDAWKLATGEDFQYAATEGRRPFGTALLNRYVARVHRSTAVDPEVLLSFYRVVHMLARPSSLFHPRIMARVLARYERRSRSAPPSSIAEALCPG